MLLEESFNTEKLIFEKITQPDKMKIHNIICFSVADTPKLDFVCKHKKTIHDVLRCKTTPV